MAQSVEGKEGRREICSAGKTYGFGGESKYLRGRVVRGNGVDRFSAFNESHVCYGRVYERVFRNGRAQKVSEPICIECSGKNFAAHL